MAWRTGVERLERPLCLFLFNQFGDLERCALRPGNVHSADGWEGVLKPVVMRYKGKVSRANFTYQAGSWPKPRRVIAKVEWHPGEFYPRVGFIVTNGAICRECRRLLQQAWDL
jgi:hypothetical protein